MLQILLLLLLYNFYDCFTHKLFFENNINVIMHDMRHITKILIFSSTSAFFATVPFSSWFPGDTDTRIVKPLILTKAIVTANHFSILRLLAPTVKYFSFIFWRCYIFFTCEVRSTKYAGKWSSDGFMHVKKDRSRSIISTWIPLLLQYMKSQYFLSQTSSWPRTWL